MNPVAFVVLGVVAVGWLIAIAVAVFAGKHDEVPTPPAPPRPTPLEDAEARLAAANGHVHSLRARYDHACRVRDAILDEIDGLAGDWCPPHGTPRP